MKLINKKNKLFILDLIAVLLTIISPFLFYLYLLAPEEVDYIYLFGFKINSNTIDIETDLWFMSNKIFTLLIVTYWFFTSSKSQQKYILFFIIFEFYKLFDFITFFIPLNNKTEYIVLINIGFTSLFVYFLIFIKNKIGYNKKLNELKTKNAFSDNSIKQLNNFSIKNYLNTKNEYHNLKQKSYTNNKNYIVQLIKIRDQLNLVNDQKN